MRHTNAVCFLAAVATALCCGLATAAPLVGDVEFSGGDGLLRLSCPRIAISFDARSGDLRAIDQPATGARVLSNAGAQDVDWQVDDRFILSAPAEAPAPRELADYAAAAVDGAGQLTLRQRVGAWTLTQTYRLRPGQAWVERRVALQAAPGQKGTLKAIRFVLPGVAIAPEADCTYSMLSAFPPADVPFPELSPGRLIYESFGWASGRFVRVHNARASRGLLAALYCETEGGTALVREADSAVDILHQVDVLSPLDPPSAVEVGAQYFGLVDGSADDVLAGAKAAYDLAGLAGPPERTRAITDRAVIYSAHPGGTIDSGFQDVGGCEQLTKSFPYLAEMGINTLWLLPFWHGQIYAPDDYYRLDERYATPDQLRQLVDAAHGQGMRVLLDLIPHGPLDTSDIDETHPDWVSRNPDGSLLYWWGCLSCDYANPGWQRYMGEHAAYWVREAGIDGYRVDCAGGGPPNWRPFDGNRPSMSGLFGALGILSSARSQMEQLKPEVLLLAEAAGPALYRSADQTYDWPLCLSILPRLLGEDPAVWVPQLRTWLQRQQATMPPGANLMRFLENHDTVRSRMRWGVDMQRALMALCAVSKGVPLVYEEQEVGHGPFLRWLYGYRASHDEMTAGSADYLAVRSDSPAVFACQRSLGDRHTVAAVNLSHQAIVATLTLPDGPAALVPRAQLSTPWPGASLEPLPDASSARLSLPPYGVGLIELPGREPVPAVAPEPVAPVGNAPEVAETPDGLSISNGLYRLTIGRAEGGLIHELAAADGTVLLEPARLTDGGRKLWPGGMAPIGPDSLRELRSERDGATMRVRAAGQMVRGAGGAADPVADYEVTYEVDAGPSVRVTLRLTPRIALDDVLGALVHSLDFGRPQQWFANTAEGTLWDDYRVLHPKDVGYRGVYLHPVGDRLYDSSAIPLHPSADVFGACHPGGQFVAVSKLAWPNEPWVGSVRLKERDGDREGLTAWLRLMGGDHAVSLPAGQTAEWAQTITVGTGGEASWRRLLEPKPDGPVSLHTEGSCYIAANSHYELWLVRGHGGAIPRLICRATGANMVSGCRIYTDYGIYPDTTDPLGQKHRATVLSAVDPEPDMTVREGPEGLELGLEGCLRNSDWDGRSAAWPPTRYRFTYRMDASPRIRVTCAIRTDMALPQAKAFLAQTISLPRMSAYAVTAAGGAERGTAPFGPDRLWQSVERGLAERPSAVVADQQAGSLHALAGLAARPALQKLFGSHAVGAAGTLFMAFLDGQPSDLQPEWREITYDLIVGPGGIVEGLAAAEEAGR